jgi:hypothetical protein
VTGTHDHRYERLRRRAEEELRARPPLPTWQRQVVERFAVEHQHGWYTLLNQFAPHTQDNRPDAVLVGPLGVFVVLLREREPRWESSRAAFVWTSELLAGATTPRGLITEAALRVVVVRPVGHRGPAGHRGEHLVVTETELHRLFRCANTEGDDRILTSSDALAVARHLDNRTFDLTPIAWNPRPVPPPREPGETATTAGSSGLFEVDQLHEEQRTHALEGPFEDWRIFLDDVQLGLVRRHYGGPARITGPAGTGKSVLALHRLAYLARRSTGPLLFTTHVRTLPRIAEHQFRSLAPQLLHRVEFTNLHAWARDFLASRDRPFDVDDAEIDAAFQAVWERIGQEGPLGQARPSRGYWKDEIDRVIKGRGIGSLPDYQSAPRKGRGGKLTTGFRAHVWKFYCEYEKELCDRGVHDHNDVLKRALDELDRKPLPRQYTAVVVDEVQDLTLIGLRLVHAISGAEPNQLLLVGDGEQQVFTGGWRLSEAGISLQGRGEILRRNYRNRAAIVDLAGEFDAVNRFDDLDGGPTVTVRSARPVLDGGQVRRWHGTEQEAALIEALRTQESTDIAVLTRTNRAAEHWIRVLSGAGFTVSPLDRWDGRSSTTIHVGTVHRAKGTEFRAVLLPDERGASGYREDHEALQRQLLVAATRARDYVWIGELDGA